MTAFWKRETFKRQLFFCILSVPLCGIFIGFYKFAMFGVDPCQSFLAGLNLVIPIAFGTLYLVANVVMLLFGLVADRHYLGIGTLLNLVFMGYVVQFTQWLLGKMFPDIGLAGRIVILVVGLVCLCFSSSLYITSDLGVSAYDCIALIIANTWHKGQFRFVRILCDFVCVLLGVLCFMISGGEWSQIGSVVGVGTIISVVFMGPLIDFFNRRVNTPLVFGKEKKDGNC